MWRALTEVSEVRMWAGVEPVRIPDGYPAAGDDALWDDQGAVLRDVILDVVPEHRLLSRLERGPASVIEEYRLSPIADGRATRLVASWRGDAALADGNDAGMERLKQWCERPAPA